MGPISAGAGPGLSAADGSGADPTEAPTLAAFAAARGLSHRAPSMALPKATQLMRHGFMQEVRSLARGDLPGGLGDGWLAQVSYVYEGRSALECSPYTLVLAEASASQRFAIRVLCHDRSLDERDRSNPDSDRQLVELDDRIVQLESAGFLDRYALSTDHDQDQLRVWQIFDPSLVDWLGGSAPAGFSFELQDGALSCFVPGLTADAGQLDALCEGAARVFSHVASIDVPAAAGTSVPPEASSASAFDRELAAATFGAPPKSIKAAAKEFRRGPFLGDQAWKLGAEAFFREHARAIGFERIELSAFRAEHLETFMPGIPTHVARGSVPGATVQSHLVLTDSEDYDDMGWSVLITAVANPAAAFGITQAMPRGDASERGSIRAGTDGRSLILSALDGGPRDRSAAEFKAFVAAGSEIVRRLR